MSSSVVLLMSACGALQSKAPTPLDDRPVVAAPDTSVDSSSTVAVPADVVGTPPSVATNPSTAAACECAESKPHTRPKPRPKALVVHQGPPAAVDTAPAQPPVNGVVDANLQLLNGSVESVLGRKVQGLKGEDFGRVVDVLTDGSGTVRVAIIDFGGFLGVGNRRIAVDWALLRADPEHQDNALSLRLTTEKLQSAPVYKESAHPQVLMGP